MPAEPNQLVGQVMVDAQRRVLRIERVCLGDPLGREVVGVLGDGSGYACSAETFREVWVERAPLVLAAQQEANRKRLNV